MGANSYLSELNPFENKDITENIKVGSPGSITIHLNQLKIKHLEITIQIA